MRILKNIVWILTGVAVYFSAMFMCWSLIIPQMEGAFYYGMATMFFGIIWNLETKHWF
jgi:hypothetical protein